MAKETVFVEGYREFMRAVARTDKDTREKVREALRKSGEGVRSDAAVLFTRYDSRSAAGYRTRVMQSGVIVNQRLKRTTGKHGWYGILQMHQALLPALAQNGDRIEKNVVKAMNEVADIFEGKP